MAKLSAQQYSKQTRYTLWIMTELAIIGSDIQEVLGSATAIKILFGWPLWVGAIITILDSFLFLFIHYFGVRKLEFFFLVLIAIMTVTFMINMIEARPDPGEMAFGTFIPTIPDGSIQAALGLVGAVIMPHNLYLHSSLVLTRSVGTSNYDQMRDAIVYNNIESAISLFVSFVISTMVIGTFAVYIANWKIENDWQPGQDIVDLDL